MSKNIINEITSGSSSSSYSSSADTYPLDPQTITYPLSVGEGYDTDYVVRDVPVAPAGTLDGIVFTKIGRMVYMTIPSFHGTMLLGNTTSLMRLVEAGTIPTRFLPVWRNRWPVNAYNNGGHIHANQDHADLKIDTLGNVDLSAQSFFWDGNAGIYNDMHCLARLYFLRNSSTSSAVAMCGYNIAGIICVQK